MKTHQAFRMYEGSRGEPPISRRKESDFCPRCDQYAPFGSDSNLFNALLCWDEFLERYA